MEFRLSPLYRSAPRHVLDQPEFWNAAASGLWPGGPYALLARIHDIETAFGRNRAAERPKGPRTLDIDILLFGEFVLDDPELSVPHPLLRERLFALAPLLDLEPALRDPRTGFAYAEFAARLGDQGVYPAPSGGLQ